jgi:kinesin family member C1
VVLGLLRTVLMAEGKPIRAIIRIRPSKPEEQLYIDAVPHRGNKFVVGPHDYTDKFATVLGPASSQHDAFCAIGLPIVESTLKGQRTCLFAYGQSGAGKTFSMYGADGGKIPSRLDGIVPAVTAEIFRRKQDVEKRGDFFLELTTNLVEVMGNTVNDLLADPDAEGKQPQARGGRGGGGRVGAV